MFDLALSDDQSDIVDSYRQLFTRELSGGVDARSAFDAALWSKAIEMGVLDMSLGPDEDRASFLDLSLIAEVAGAYLAPIPLPEAVAATRLLAALDSPAAGRLLERVVGGEILATVSPRPAGQGMLLAVPAGAIADAVVFRDGLDVVAGSQPPPPDVAPTLGSLPVSDRCIETDIEVLGSGVSAVAAFETARLEWQALVTAALVGAGRRVLQIGVDYTSQRHAFGVPIATFQTVSHRLAETATSLDGALLLSRKAAWAAEADPRRWPVLAEMAVAQAAQSAGVAADEVLHFHGGYGMILEYDIPHFFQRIKAWSMLVGDRLRHVQAVGELWAQAAPV